MQAVEVEAVEADATFARLRLVVFAEPADKIEHVCVAPHPGRESPEVGQGINGVFIRAIRDAGRECQHVESSERAGEHQGFPVWQARCSDGGTWTIVVMNDGTAAVINADEVQLVNQAAAQNAQGQ